MDAESSMSFELVTHGRTFIFHADTQADRVEWMKVLKGLIDGVTEKRSKRMSVVDDTAFAIIPQYQVRDRRNVDRAMYSIYKEGYLVKKGAQVKSWRRRYFILRSGTLFYFKDEIDSEPVGTIDLEQCYRVASAEAMLNESNSFEVVTVGRTFYLIADNEQEMQDWIKTISQVIRYFRPRTTPESSTESAAIVIQGWLSKEGGMNKAWRNRWFVLRGSTLTYFKTQQDSQTITLATGAIALEGAMISIAEGHRFNFCFSISTAADRTYNLVAKDRQEMERWYQAIADTITRCAVLVPTPSKDQNFLQKSKNAILTTINNVKVFKPTMHVPASDPSSDVIFSGWLMKSSRGQQERALSVSSWQHRFFILKNHCFYYYKTPNDTEAIGVIELDDAKLELITENTEATALLGKMKAETLLGSEWAQGYGDALRNKWGFVVTTTRKKYFMITAQQHLAAQWIDATKRSETQWNELLKHSGIPEGKYDKDTAKAVAKIVRARAPSIESFEAAKLEQLMSGLDDVLQQLKDGDLEDEQSDSETTT